MTRRQRYAAWAGVGVASLLLALTLLLLVFTQTDWGRERVRVVAVDWLNESLDARVEIDRLEGNLLFRWRFVDVAITDLEDRPFVAADTIATAFSLRGLLRRRIELTNTRLVHAHVVLDHPPGEKWNYARILPEPDPDAPLGWGAWIRIRDAEVIRSRITIRAEWRPDDELTPAERERRIAEALDPESRANIQRVPGGFQNIMDFRRIDAAFNELLLADPDVDRTEVDVAALRAIAQPYRPPAADVRALEGRFYISRDSVWFSGVRARLPGSQLTGSGVYDLETAGLVLRLAGAPLAFDDMRWLYPRFPEEGGGDLRLGIHRRQAATRIEAEEMDVRVRESELRGDLRLVVGDTFRILPTDLEFDRLDSRLVDRMIPGFDFPRHGRLDGRLALVGTPAAMRVDGDVTFDDERVGRNRVIARGQAGANGELWFRDLALELRPLRTDILRDRIPRLPAGAAITGTARLTGTFAGPLDLAADLAVDDPVTGRSRVVASGTIDPEPGHVVFSGFEVRFDPLRADLVRPELPQLPAAATIAGELRLDGSTAGRLDVDGDLTLRDPATGESRVGATGGIILNGAVRFSDLDVRFRPLRLDLLRHELPDLPPGATLAGTARLDGDPAGVLRLAGEMTIRDPASGESVVAARGAVDLTRELAFRGLDLELRPLQVELVRRFQPDLPLAGTLEGTATLDGRPGSRFAVRGDITHREAGELSRVAGRVELVPDARVAINVQVLPLSLNVAGRFVPAAGLRGSVRGSVRASGPLANLRFGTELDVADGGSLTAAGTLDLAAAEPGYDMQATFRMFDLSAVTVRAPATTSLTGDLDATGRGLDPATMRAELRADLVGSSVDDLAADEVRVRMGIADGLARVDSSFLRVGPAAAWADGRFGLVAGRHGDLRYRVVIDELAAFEPWFPPADTGIVEPRPAVRVAALEEARAAVERAERRRLVEAIATGATPPLDPVPVDTIALAGLPRDTLAGRFEAAGMLSGNIERFDLTGRAVAEELAVRGVYVGEGRAEYAWLRRGRSEPIIELDAEAERLFIEGFALDSARAHIRHHGERYGTGRAVVTAWADDDTDLAADLQFTLALERSELLVHDLAVRIDTVHWRSTSPSRLSWDGAAVEVDSLELRSDIGGLVFVDGRLPVDGPADLDLRLRDVELGHLAALVQDDADVEGRLGLDARVQGTLDAPRLRGDASLVDAARNGTPVPDLRLTFAYEDRELVAQVRALDDGHVLAEADARLPIDLALADRAGSRLLPGTLVVDVRADSLPVDALPAITDLVTDADGVLAGSFTVRGGWEAIELTGYAAVHEAAFTVEATGVRYRDVAGAFTLAGGTLQVDSLVGWSGGPVRVTGQVDLSTLAEPGFDLAVRGENVWAIRTRDFQVRLDADLEVAGPFDAVVVSGQAATREGVVYTPERRGAHVVDLYDPALEHILPERMLARHAELLQRPPRLLANLLVDVDLEIRRDTWVRSTDYNVEVYTPVDVGPLHLQLDPVAGRLTLTGTVNSDRGHYSFMGRRFRVTRGAATFTGDADLDPMIQVTVEHAARIPGREEIAIRVILSGTLQEPELAIESDARPPVTTTDLFTYIALGRATGSLLQQQGSGLGGLGGPGGDLVGNVAGLATMQMAAVAASLMLNELEAEMARELGIDVVHISPADLPAELLTGQFADLLRGTEIELGSYIGRRLFASVRARPTTEARPGATLEYATRGGYRFTTSVDPRFLPPEPTLEELDPRRTSVFGGFIFREWRF